MSTTQVSNTPHVIFDGASNKIVGIAADKDTAHMFAEVYSYKLNRNAIYGLFKIRLIPEHELGCGNTGYGFSDEWIEAENAAHKEFWKHTNMLSGN